MREQYVKLCPNVCPCTQLCCVCVCILIKGVLCVNSIVLAHVKHYIECACTRTCTHLCMPRVTVSRVQCGINLCDIKSAHEDDYSIDEVYPCKPSTTSLAIHK